MDEATFNTDGIPKVPEYIYVGTQKFVSNDRTTFPTPIFGEADQVNRGSKKIPSLISALYLLNF